MQELGTFLGPQNRTQRGCVVLSHLRHYAKQTNLQIDLFQALVYTRTSVGGVDADGAVAAVLVSSALPLVARVTLRRRLQQQGANK